MKLILVLGGIWLLFLGNAPAGAQSTKLALSPNQSVASSYSPSDLNRLVNAGTLGAQPTKLPAKNGKYGISFNAVAVTDLYIDQVLNQLDDLVEQGSVGLNPGSSQLTEYVIDQALDQVANLDAKQGNTEVAKSGYGSYRAYYARFVQSLRQQLAGVNYPDVMQSDPVSFFAEKINTAVTQQCISYCQNSMMDWGLANNSKPAGGYFAMQAAYLLGITNVAKQDNPIYKMLYDAYIAKNSSTQYGQLYGAYQPLVKQHGTTVPFTLYGLQFGSVASALIHPSKDAAPVSLWDTTCNCPSSELYTKWSSFSAPNAFIVP